MISTDIFKTKLNFNQHWDKTVITKLMFCVLLCNYNNYVYTYLLSTHSTKLLYIVYLHQAPNHVYTLLTMNY